MKLIILDRDGVINQDSDDYIKNAAEWIPIPGSIEAIARLSKAGYTVVIATNQSGLSRGLFGIDELEDMHNKMCRLTEAAGGFINGIFYCPHLPEEQCQCRKPAAGLFSAISTEFDTSLSGIPAIGDTIRDLKAALKLGCKSILVRTGKGLSNERLLSHQKDPRLNNVPVFDDLAATVDFLLTH
jgi:D-glycero-D-manno-heptose 1,7-bisphosphate phosphatase